MALGFFSSELIERRLAEFRDREQRRKSGAIRTVRRRPPRKNKPRPTVCTCGECTRCQSRAKSRDASIRLRLRERIARERPKGLREIYPKKQSEVYSIIRTGFAEMYEGFPIFAEELASTLRFVR